MGCGVRFEYKKLAVGLSCDSDFAKVTDADHMATYIIDQLILRKTAR